MDFGIRGGSWNQSPVDTIIEFLKIVVETFKNFLTTFNHLDKLFGISLKRNK